MRTEIIQALRSHAQGNIDKHKANVEVYMRQVVGIGEHSDIIETLEKELNQIAMYEDQLEALDKHFPLDK